MSSVSASAAPERTMNSRLRVAGVWVVRDGWVGVALVALIIAFTIKSPLFLTKSNWLNTSSTATEVLLLALGETFVIISGGIDLSVGAVLGLSGMSGGRVMSELIKAHMSTAGVITLGFAAALIVGLVFGLINGWLIARLSIPPFVVTLGTLGVAAGAADLLNNGLEIDNIPSWVGSFGNKNVAGWLPIPVLIAAACCVIAALALRKTRFGSNTYTIGDSKDAALRAGIPYTRHLVKIYAVCGLLAGLDGILVMSRLASASPSSGAQDNLNAIAAVVIGGASLFGGKGNIGGSILGTLIISVLLTGLVIINVPPFWQQIAVGIVLVLAVYVDQASERLRQRA